MQKKIRGYLDRVQCDQPGTVPLMIVMRHQGKGVQRHLPRRRRRRGQQRTKSWYDDFADSVGDARVVIAFEPDSLGTVDCLARDRRKERLRHAALRRERAVTAAERHDVPRGRRVRLGGRLSDREQLRYIGISKVRGFMLNVTHHDWTRANIEHGLEISRMVGGKHFIINTSYNGRGPLHYRKWINKAQHKWRTINVWCHPGLRGLGPAPTTATANPHVDAYMYINRPGYSAGSCNGGPLPVGTWWPERALMYAQYAPTGCRRRPARSTGCSGTTPSGSSAPSDNAARRRRGPARARAGSGSSAGRWPGGSRRGA